MTALDLGAATRTLTPPASGTHTSLPYGDATLNIAGTGTSVPLTTWNGSPAIGGADTPYLTSATPFAIPQDSVIFIATAGLPTGMGNWELVWHYSGFDIGVNDQYLVYGTYGGGGDAGDSVELPTPITPTDIVVWCIVSNSVEGRILNSLDGTLTVTASAQAATPSDGFDVYPHADAHLLGVWQFDGVIVSETDALDTMAAIVAEFSASTPSTDVAGAGGWGIGGSGTPVLSDSLGVPPEPPIVTPGGSSTPPAVPPLVIPDDVEDPVINRISKTYPAPTLGDDGFPVDWTPTLDIREPYARMQIVVEGVDVTWIDGVPTPMPAYSRVEPFGSYSTTLVFPQISTFHSTPAWAKKGANVSVRLVRISDSEVIQTFSGVAMLVGRREDDREFRLVCTGTMFVGDLQLRLPGFTLAPRDIGHVIADALNGVVSRRYSTVAKVTTGVKTSVEGGWEPTLTGYVQGLLATCINPSGQQYTVKCVDTSPVIALKDTTTVHWEIRAGQDGIDVDLEDDGAESPTTIYGEGTNPDGGHWANWKFPRFKADETPPYPYSPPDTSIKVGTTDAMTDTGTGVSVWQAKAGQPVTGYFSINDRAALIRIQREAAITVDGFLGPQSWASTFNTGANVGGAFADAFIAPLAASPSVLPLRRNADGMPIGNNPQYDPDVVPVVRYINYGTGVWKADAIKDAEKILARDSGDGWAGTITFVLDPPQGSKYEIREGQNIMVRGLSGQDVLVHIAAVDSSPEDDGAPVQCTVDQRARDYPTLEAIRERDRAAVDPAMVAYKRVTTGSIGTDWAVYDAESPGGVIPKHAVYGGLWDVRQIPMGVRGTVPRMWMRTSNPVSEFAVGAFLKKVTAADLQGLMGNPLSDSYTDDPWQIHGDALRAMGLAASWGWEAQPAGYDPRQKTNPSGDSGAPLTGRLEDQTSWEYGLVTPPWIYIATITNVSCEVEGRLYGSGL